MLHPPLDVVLTWPKPNYVDPISQGPARIVLSSILAPTMTLVVGLRAYTRLAITKNWGLDDTLILMALTPALAFNAVICYVDVHKYGSVHIWDIPLEAGPKVYKLLLVAEVLYFFATLPAKMSFLTLYRRMLGNSHRPVLNHLMTGCGILVVGVSVSYFFTSLFQCSPVKALWTLFPPYPYTCINDWSLFVLSSLLTVTDFWILILPFPIIWKLQIPARRRVSIISILGLSFFACLAGLARTILTVQWVTSYDESWETWGFGLAAIVELDLGIMCASAPALWPFVARHLTKGGRTHSRSKQTPNQFIRLEERPTKQSHDSAAGLV